MQKPITQPKSETIGQRFTLPSNRGQDFNYDCCEDEPPFEPHNPSKTQLRNNQPPSELPFDTSNLTCALQFGPPPLLNSTPQRGGPYQRTAQLDQINAGNYVHTQRLPRFSDYFSQADGPISPENESRRQLENMEWRRNGMGRRSEIQDRPENDAMLVTQTFKLSNNYYCFSCNFVVIVLAET